MKLCRTKDYEAMSRLAANILSAFVILEPRCVLGFPTGSTPVGMYRRLVRQHRNGEVDFSRVRTVNLDEYLGLAPDHSQSYRRFMQENLFDHINIKPENTHLPDGLAEDPDAECLRYDGIIEDLGGVDVQVLGMGHNGHIGFNEPAETFTRGTHVAELTAQTIEANARFFASGDEVPRRALTMGIRSIMNARRILLLVSGAGKADILRAALTGPITPRVPASVLQLHPDVTLVADEAALAGI